MNNVGALVAPVADHTLAAELSTNHLLVVAVAVRSILQLSDLLEAGRGAHELEDRVNSKGATKLSLKG